MVTILLAAILLALVIGLPALRRALGWSLLLIAALYFWGD
jgi:hypothetical protein